MKYLPILLAHCLWNLVQAQETKIKHQFVCIGNHKNVLVYVDQFNPEKSWSVKIPKGSRDIQLLSPQKLLVSHGTGAAEYRLSDGKKLTWSVNGYKGIQSARRLDNGNTILLSISGEITILDKTGEKVSSLQIRQKQLDLRLIRVNSDGSWVVGSKKPQAILEINSEGEVLQQINLPGKSYTATRRINGNYLASTGDECKVVEIKPNGAIVRFFGGKQEHPTLKLDFNSGWEELNNGNIVMTNWLGHAKHNTGPHLIEFDNNNKVVWTWENHDTVKQVTNLLIIQ